MSITDAFRPPKTKVCKICKVEKPIDDFVIHVQNKDNRSSDCRACKKDKEEKKKRRRKEKAKTFFDAKYFALFFLLSASTAFSQARPTADSIPPYCNTAGVTLITSRRDTVRAICLITMGYVQKGVAHARMGFVVIEQGRRPVYLDCRKRAIKWPMVGWDWREVDVKYKK